MATAPVSAPAPRPVGYMARTRDFYAAQGFTHAYRWASHDDAPFAPLGKPLADCTLGLVTTASLTPRAALEPRTVASGSLIDPPARLYTDDLSWDKQATHTEDVNSFCPFEALAELVAQGRIRALTPRFHCAPTEYSQRATEEHDAPEILRRLREDGTDIALLVPL
ncbi:MAG: hypothetical protein RIC56_12110 [Pseudomonadales bacterium]